MARRDELIVGLDIGTSSVRCLVASGSDSGHEVRGYAQTPSEGVFRGEIVDFGRCAAAIARCVQEAAAASGVQNPG